MGAKILSFCRNLCYSECSAPGQKALDNLGMATVSAPFNAAFRENVKQTKKINSVCIT